MKNFKIYKTIIVIIISSLFLVSCGIYKPVDARKQPAQAKDRAKKILLKVEVFLSVTF